VTTDGSNHLRISMALIKVIQYPPFYKVKHLYNYNGICVFLIFVEMSAIGISS